MDAHGGVDRTIGNFFPRSKGFRGHVDNPVLKAQFSTSCGMKLVVQGPIFAVIGDQSM
jgi:hypothetical protein